MDRNLLLQIVEKIKIIEEVQSAEKWTENMVFANLLYAWNGYKWYGTMRRSKDDLLLWEWMYFLS